VSLADLERAARRVRQATRRTPLLALELAARTPRGGPATLLVKAESLQVTGSFKARGAYNAIAALTRAQRARGVVAYSSGNHAGAVAYAARVLGAPAVVFMPEHAPAVKIAAARGNGADVVLVGRSSDERRDRAHEHAHTHAMALIPSADHLDVIAGQGTVGLEIIAQLREALRAAPDPARLRVLVPVGGGGIAAGVATAVTALAPGARVIGVEPALAADGAASLRAGRLVAWPSADVDRTIADGLRLTSLGVSPFAHLRARLDGIVLVEEADIRAAVAWAARNARLVLEPSGATALAAALYHRSARAAAGEVTVCVASGGNVDPPMLRALLAEFEDDERVPLRSR